MATKKEVTIVLGLVSVFSALQVQLHGALSLPSTRRLQSTTRTTTTPTTLDYSIIQRGGLFIQPNWINAEQIAALRRDIYHLRELPVHTAASSASEPSQNNSAFIPSGLSNRVNGDGNIFGKSDRLTCTITAELDRSSYDNGSGSSSIRDEMDEKLIRLADDVMAEHLLSSHNDKHTHNKALSLEEQYYSISPTGSLLPRHMDERHEETKGEKAWMSETRRSVSWLLYLSDDNVEGGELRAFIRNCKGPYCGAHDGNIQIGWLGSDSNHSDLGEDENENNDNDVLLLYDPVFLDSWVKTPIDHDLEPHPDDEDDDEHQRQWQPLYALYRIKNNNRDNNKQEQERQYLSNAFGHLHNSPDWPASETSVENFDFDLDITPEKFGQALSKQLFAPFSNQFISTEEIHGHPTDVVPTAGTLVLFDSVAIPHEVLKVTRGERLALAGWFHEPQQSFPEWYGT
jgi:hypothetical protein